MNWRCDFGKYHFHIGLSRSAIASGVNSKLDNGRHFLMWDFDDKEFDYVYEKLSLVQMGFGLSEVYVVNTGQPCHYHAYCFTSRSWADALHILASTAGLDEVYFKIGVVRGFFTLRYSKKAGRSFTLSATLRSPIPADVDPYSVPSLCQYWTKRI